MSALFCVGVCVCVFPLRKCHKLTCDRLALLISTSRAVNFVGGSIESAVHDLAQPLGLLEASMGHCQRVM